MNFMSFMAAIGLVISTFLLGVAFAGLHEAGSGKRKKFVSSLGALPFGLVFVSACCAVSLSDPGLIRPQWVQYSFLIGFPLLIGYISRRLMARRIERSQSINTGK